MTTAAPALPSRREIRIAFVGIMLAMLLPAMTTTIVSTALPSIVSDLGGLSDLSWIVTAYMLSSTICIPLAGKASDIVGRRPLYQIAIAVYVTGSILCGLSQTIEQLVAARAFQGLGGGSLVALSYAAIGDIVPATRRGSYQGYVGMAYATATFAGPLVGGFTVDHLSWRWVFFMNIPLGLLAAAVIHRKFTVTHQRRSVAIDYLGAALLTTAVTSLLLIGVVVGRGNKVILPPSAIILAGVALTAIVLLVPVERRAAEPVIPIALFSDDVFAVGNTLMFLQGIGLMAPLVLIPTFLQIGLDASATTSGLMLVPLMGGMVAASTVAGWLVTWSGRYKPYPILGSVLLCTGFGLLGTIDTTSSHSQIAVYLAVTGLGVGFGRQVIILAVQNAVDAHHLGVATSSTQVSHMVGATLGLTAIGPVVNLRLLDWVGRVFPGGLPEGLDVDEVASSPSALSRLPEETAMLLREGVADAISFTFRLGVPVLLLAIFAAIALGQRPLEGDTSTEAPTSAPGRLDRP